MRGFATLRRAMLAEVLRALVEELVDAKEPMKGLMLSHIPSDVVMSESGEKWALKLPQLAKPDPPRSRRS